MDLVESDFRTENRHPWELARFSIVQELIEKYNQSTAPSILDVGSGDAYVAHRFTKEIQGVQSFCVDIEYNETIKDKIQSIYQNPALHLYDHLDQVKNLNTADFVTLLDVIEHVPDDVALLKEIAAKPFITRESYFVITVPAYQKLYSSHDDLLKHFRRYDMKMLQNTLKASDLEFVEGGYFFTSLLGPRILQVLKERGQKKDPENLEHLGTWDKSKKITNWVHSVLLYDYKTGRFMRRLGMPLPGLSLYGIARKK